jgi:predicted 2-oxoglutarate/Fe(II)-dependent dioxygenase YbiX
MSKRLQVVLSDEQYREVRTVARRSRQTIAEWVRALLRAACRRAPRGGADRKLAAIRAASRHRFPTADIDKMLRQIESGYGRAGS